MTVHITDVVNFALIVMVISFTVNTFFQIVVGVHNRKDSKVFATFTTIALGVLLSSFKLSYQILPVFGFYLFLGIGFSFVGALIAYNLVLYISKD